MVKWLSGGPSEDLTKSLKKNTHKVFEEPSCSCENASDGHASSAGPQPEPGLRGSKVAVLLQENLERLSGKTGASRAEGEG